MPAFPSSTPAEKPYKNLLNSSQYARNNFRPTKRGWRRTLSAQETPSALSRNLKHYWGYNNFRHPQLEICTDVLRGCDTIVVAPTGLGKSICFQLPAITIEHGVTIVVSPLKALMTDQVAGLVSRGIRAIQLSEYSTLEEHNEVRRQMRMGHPEMRLLYVTPEMLLSDKHRSTFDIAYRQKQIARLVVDEAHVITEWGTSFRGKYRELGEFRERYYDVPITALTASATKRVRDDIIQTLRIRKGYGQWVMPFNRRNLFYEIRYQGRGSLDEDDEPEPQKSTLEDIVNFLFRYRPEAMARNRANGIDRQCVTGIVYCRTTAACEDVAEGLRQKGIKAMPYYKNLNKTIKDDALARWKDGSIECIVATIAFGMGIDQANVRYVIHYQMPKTFEGYYQETGRAGRDGHISHCLLYYSREDAKYLQGLVEQEDIKQRRIIRSKTGNAHADLPISGLSSFRALQSHIETTGRCRHVGICTYFGESIDAKDPEVKAAYCEDMCDVCKDSAKVRKAAMQLSDGIPVLSLSPRPDSSCYHCPIPETEHQLKPLSDFPVYKNAVTGAYMDEELLISHSLESHISEDQGSESLKVSKYPGFRPIIKTKTDQTYTSSDNIRTSLHTLPFFPSSTIIESRTPLLPAELSTECVQSIKVQRISQTNTHGEPSSCSIASKKRKLQDEPNHSDIRKDYARTYCKIVQQRGEIENVGRKKALVCEYIDDPQPPFATARLGPQAMAMKNIVYINDSAEGSAAELKLTKEQRVKAEKLLNSVAPARGSGPYKCYNAAPPMPRVGIITASANKTFKPPLLKSTNEVRCELLVKAARDQAVMNLSNALKDSLAHGDLARKILKHWGRNERGTSRINALIGIARLIERDIANTHRENPSAYIQRISELCKSTKAFRSCEVVEAILRGETDMFDDKETILECVKIFGQYLENWDATRRRPK
nr:ATP-dependent DNA helicase [Cryptococcus depauperatus CBS 7841]